MKKNLKHIEEHRKSFEIEIPASEVKKRKEELYLKLGKTASLPGFRAGKAPRDLLVKHYGDRVAREVIEDLVSDSYHRAIEEEGFIPLGLPAISDVKLDGSDVLCFNAEFNIRPKIALGRYKGLKLSAKKIEIGEKDVEKSVNVLRESNAKFKTADGRPVKIGDYIVCDSEVFVDGKSIGKKRENVWMPIEEKSYIPGLSAQLSGANVSDEKQIEAELPLDFGSKEYAGKKAAFKIKIKEIKERFLPQIDDEFAKDLGYNDLAGLNESIKKILEEQSIRRQRQDLERQTVEKLLADADFNAPGALVEEQLNYLMREEKERLLKQGVREDDVKEKEKDLQERLRPIAVKQVKTMFILDEIAHAEKIGVSEEEIGGALEGIAIQYNQTKGRIEKHYRENNLISDLRADLRNAKIMDLLVKEADIKECPSSPNERIG